MPDDVAEELTRVAGRWQQLPLDHARRRLPQVRALVEELAGEPVPDLGPGVVIDQLTVIVYDACSRARAAADNDPRAATRPPALRAGSGRLDHPKLTGSSTKSNEGQLTGIRNRLADLRRSL